ncbi:GIY-YIG nuclease family protein [Pirellulales bacterium]|nr:GIY-YIG nuclease family protein [Pirellulales bacterium]
MGYIYMADVETFEGIRGIRIGRTNNLPSRMSSHKNDPQWRKFKPLQAWVVDDEKTAESILKRALKQYGRPIHGNETFCHSINPIQITRGVMDDGKIRPLSMEPTAAEQYGVLILFATLAAMLFVPVLVKAIQIFCAGVAWFFSTYTMPFLIGAAWVGLVAVPITVCVLIYRYGMNAAKEIQQEENLYAKQNADFPTSNPLTN